MGFHLKSVDIDVAAGSIFALCSQAQNALANAQKAIDGVVGLTSFSGKGADSIKAYFGDIHAVNIVTLSLLFTAISDRFAMYMDGFYTNVDNSLDGHFHEETLNETSAFFSDAKISLSGINNGVNAAFNNISDIMPRAQGLTSFDAEANDCIHISNDLKTAFLEHEDAQGAAFAELDELLDAFSAVLDVYRSPMAIKAIDYTPGGISEIPEIAALVPLLEDVVSYHEENEQAIGDAYNAWANRIQTRYELELAEAMFWDGFTQVTSAAVIAAIGAVVIFSTGGAAAPVVIAFLVAGTFETAEATEGLQKIHNSRTGNLDGEAYNFIRDSMLFNGNQDMYDKAKFISESVAFISIPISEVGLLPRAGIYIGETAAQECVLRAAVIPIIDETLGDAPAGRIATLTAELTIGVSSPGGHIIHRATLGTHITAPHTSTPHMPTSVPTVLAPGTLPHAPVTTPHVPNTAPSAQAPSMTPHAPAATPHAPDVPHTAQTPAATPHAPDVPHTAQTSQTPTPHAPSPDGPVHAPSETLPSHAPTEPASTPLHAPDNSAPAVRAPTPETVHVQTAEPTANTTVPETSAHAPGHEPTTKAPDSHTPTREPESPTPKNTPEDTPSAHKPTEDVKPHSPDNTKAGESTPTNHPTGEHPAGEHATGEHATGEHATGEHPAGEHPAGEHSPSDGSEAIHPVDGVIPHDGSPTGHDGLTGGHEAADGSHLDNSGNEANDAKSLEDMNNETTNSAKPYSSSRPSFGKTQVDDVWNANIDQGTGNVHDPSGAIITWDRNAPRKGQWDMGHVPGQKYSEMHERYMNGEIELEEFKKWYRDPVHYRPELPTTNQGHQYE